MLAIQATGGWHQFQMVGGTYWNAVAPTGMLLFHPSGSKIQQMDDNIWGVVKFGLH
jgi:hypothetical protein